MHWMLINALNLKCSLEWCEICRFFWAGLLEERRSASNTIWSNRLPFWLEHFSLIIENFALIKEDFHLQIQVLSLAPESCPLHQPKFLTVAGLKKVGPKMESATNKDILLNPRVRIKESESVLRQVPQGICILEVCGLLSTTFFLLAVMVDNFW